MAVLTAAQAKTEINCDIVPYIGLLLLQHQLYIHIRATAQMASGSNVFQGKELSKLQHEGKHMVNKQTCSTSIL